MALDTLSLVSLGPAAGTQANAVQQTPSVPGRTIGVADRAPEAEVQDRAEVSHPQSVPQTAVSYFIDRESKHLYFKVVDEQTGHVVRQVPAEEVLNGERHIAEFLAQAEERHQAQKT